MKTLLIFVLSLLAVLPAVAQTRTSAEGVRQDIRAVRASTTEEIRNARQGAMSGIKNMRQDMRMQYASTSEEIRGALMKKREESRLTIATMRDEMKKRVVEKRDALKQGLLKVKDVRKKQVVERIDARLDEINKNRTDHFAKNLEQLEDVLGKIIARADNAEANGRDVSASRSAIIEASGAVSAGRNAVQVQVAKTYPITIIGEALLRADVAAARDALRKDLDVVREMIKAAHDAVRNAAVALAQVPRGLNEQEEQPVPVTSTATSTP